MFGPLIYLGTLIGYKCVKVGLKPAVFRSRAVGNGRRLGNYAIDILLPVDIDHSSFYDRL